MAVQLTGGDAVVNLLSSTLVFLQIIQAGLGLVFVRAKQLRQDDTVNYQQIAGLRDSQWSLLADNYFKLKKRNTSKSWTEEEKQEEEEEELNLPGG